MKLKACKWTPLAFMALLAAMPVRAADVPRYKLEVGQELVYEGTTRFKYQNGSHGTTDKTTFWVTGKNADASWHIIAENENTFTQSIGPGNQESPGRKEKSLDAFELFPDGRIGNPPQGYKEKGLPSTFIRLPADNAATQAGWEQVQDDGDKALFALAPKNDPASGKWIFEKTDKGVFNEVYLSTSKAFIHFDAKRGLITKVESEYTQGYGFDGKGTGTKELKSDTRKKPDWIAQLAQETDLLQKAKTSVKDAFKAVKDGGDPEKVNAAAEKSLRDGRNKVKLPMIVAHFDEQLKEFGESSKYYAEEKKREEDVLNKPAADWNTTDIDGKKHSLAGYRGKVLVLDFWYRGCGWCIKAMPQIKEVADHYKNKPVAVLGMNTDREEKDARFVVDKLSLNYTTLKAQGLPEKYGVQGFPTLIIIDQKGVVRGRHVGYSPTLRGELVKQIDGLLAGQN
jgi:thiol-disulfide isomerase/thioredoxin